MAKMKDSGIEWIGEIPEDWEITRCKYIMTFQNGYSFDSKDLVNETGESVIRIGDIQNGTVNFEDALNYTKRITPELETFKILDNDILIAMSGATVGKIGFYQSRNFNGKTGYINQRVGIIRSKSNKFLFYYLSTKKFIEYILLNSAGSAQPNVSGDMVMAYPILIPPMEIQKRITDFLDDKCGKIDSLKSDIQKQIETLEQYKKSVITEAVTKGINLDAKMKDSCVEWIGNIPETWIVDNPKYHFTQRKDRAKYGLKQLTASQKYGVITQEEYMEKTGAKVVLVEKDFEILKLVCPGDFVIHMRSFQGGLEYSENYGSISSAYVMLIPQKTIAEPRFYKWFFKSPVYIDALSSTSNLIRDGQAMRYANFIQLPIPIPPAEEQKEIADYLDSKCLSIDNIINSKKQQLEKLEEYKKSLIFEYVTGKREVS